MRLIDADALKKQFEDRSLEDFTHLHFIDAIDNAPTVEPTFGLFKEMLCAECDKRPKGGWTEHYDNSDGFTWLTCSRCMCKAYEDDYNFCPNCGAEMRKEAEE